jgi:hypothetical protein
MALEYRNNFRKNISLIKEKNPSLYQRLKASSGNDLIRTAKNGEPTLKVGDLYLESKFNPRKSALRYIQSIKTNKRFFIFMGCGLGYHINALMREGGCGILIERSVDIFKAALFVLDADVLGRLTLLIGLGKDEVGGRIKDLSFSDAVIVRHAQEIRNHRGYFREIEGVVIERRNEKFASEFTQLESQKLWVRNILHNLSSPREKYYLGKELLGKFSGPVMLVASGPFFECIIEEIKQYAGRIPIFSLLPSVPYLLNHGVEPDFIITTDAGFGNRYRMIPTCPVPLITTYSVDPSIVKHWSGNVYLFSHCLPLEEVLHSVTDYSISIPMQGSSSLVMILLARAMGFSKIFLGGYDFAYRGIKDHQRGAGFDSLSIEYMSRINTWQTQIFRMLHGQKYIRAHDQEGCEVYTSHKLLLYKNWLEAELLDIDLVRLNNGVKINGIRTAAPSILRKYNKERYVFLESMKGLENRRIDSRTVLEDLRTLRTKLGSAEGEADRIKHLFGQESFGHSEAAELYKKEVNMTVSARTTEDVQMTESVKMTDFVIRVLNKRLELLEAKRGKDACLPV